MDRRRAFATLAGMAFLLTLGGCLEPVGRGPVIIPPPSRPAVFDPSGRWCYEDRRGRVHMQRIDGYRDAIVVHERGARDPRREYRRVGRRVYEEVGGPGRYRFHRDETATWDRNVGRRGTVTVYRCRRR